MPLDALHSYFYITLYTALFAFLSSFLLTDFIFRSLGNYLSFLNTLPTYCRSNLNQIALHNTSKLEPFLSYQYHISCYRFCNAWLILALNSLFGLTQEIPVQYFMEEESSFFDRERDKLSREITAVRKHNGLLECGLKCAYRDLKNYYPQAIP